jgi:acyl carrier protein
LTSNSPGSVQIDRDDVERTIIAIVSRHRGYPEDRIKPDTDLVGDLGIAGDDADPILVEIMKAYSVNFSQTKLADRFGSEGLWPWQVPVLLFKILIHPIQRWVLGKSPREISRPGVLVSDIVDLVMAKRA